MVGEIAEAGFRAGDDETERFYKKIVLENMPLGRIARYSVHAYYQRSFQPREMARLACGRIGCAADKTASLKKVLTQFGRQVAEAKQRKVAA